MLCSLHSGTCGGIRRGRNELMCSGKADKSNYDNVTELGPNLLYYIPKPGHSVLSFWIRCDSVRFRYFVRIELRATTTTACV